MATHDDRIATLNAAFLKANDEMIARLEGLDDAAAGRNPGEGWNAAQIGAHVALTTEFLSAVLAGKVAEMVVPRPDGFTEQLATMQMPDRVKTFPQLEPGDASRQDAVAKLRASAEAFAGAVAAATPERCDATCIAMPFGATFSLYEVGEFMGAHVSRHAGQMERTLGA